MIRNLIAAVVACVYVAGSVLMVQNAGQTYRASLNKTKPLASKIDTASPSETEPKDQVVRSVAAPDIDKPRFKPARSTPAPVPVVEPPGKPAVDPVSPAQPATELAKAEAIALPAAEKKAAPLPAAKAVPAKPLANDAFWNRPQLTKVWDVGFLKPDDERQLREDFHELIIRFNPLVEDPSPWLSRVEDATEPLLKTLRRKEIRYKYFILDSDLVNAFSIPGGYVYISRGLFNLIGEDEDYALQFAIGHEIAHVDEEHAIKCLRDPGVMKMHEGTLQKLFMLVLPFGYLRNDSAGKEVDQEFQADEWVANRMQQLGRTRREILVFLQKLEGYSKAHGFYDGCVKPQPGRDLSPLENHYRAQTAARTRLKHLKSFMDAAAKTPK